jgi:hypothetical protein
MMDSFERFWQAWPSSPRKGGKSQCRAKWDKLKLDIQIEDILAHLEYMKKSDQWMKSNGSFIPAPLVYLNQMRWDGFELPKPTKIVDAVVEVKERLAQGTAMPDHIRERLKSIRNKTVGLT